MSESESRSLTAESSDRKTAQRELQDQVRRVRALGGVTLPVGGSAPVYQPVLVTTAAIIPPKPKLRHHSAATGLLYKRIREIPLRGVALKDFCQRCDRMQSAFPVPKNLRDDGCPAKWFDAWKDQDWRRKIHDLRQNAWRNQPKKVV
jgi:hypothetical protein